MQNPQIKVGDQFQISESGKKLLTTKREKGADGNFTVKYYDNSHEPLILTEKQIQHYINFGSWRKVKI